MGAWRVVFTGGDDLEAEVAKQVLDPILTSIRQDARRLVPILTGRLRGSIRQEREGLTGRVGSDVEYAGFVELGTSRMAAQPYLAPALYRARG
jgi:HK97 gp10 family phage protein